MTPRELAKQLTWCCKEQPIDVVLEAFADALAMMSIEHGMTPPSFLAVVLNLTWVRWPPANGGTNETPETP
jgi:hypothetical protein